jgi:hypothetical protein
MNLHKKLYGCQTVLVAFLCFVLIGIDLSRAQANQQAGVESQVTRKIGTATSLAGNTIILKTDAGDEIKAVVQENARIVRIAPGEKDLKNAVPVPLQDLLAGDRLLVGGKAANDASFLVFSVVVIKQTDVAQKQAHEREDWQKRGVGGIVKAIDASSGDITIAITPSFSVLVKTSATTSFFRYSSESIRFSDAKHATLAEIKIGDQLRARGNRSPDQKELAAEQVISGSFRNIAGTIVAIDATKGTLTVKDLLTKKTVVVTVTADSHLQKLSVGTAQRMAAMLKKPSQGSSASTPPAGGGADSEKPTPPADVQQVVSKAPAITLAELQKEGAVIMVSTEGNGSEGLKAITVLSGAEPILTAAPEGKAAAAILSGWNLAAVLNDSTAQ